MQHKDVKIINIPASARSKVRTFVNVGYQIVSVGRICMLVLDEWQTHMRNKSVNFTSKGLVYARTACIWCKLKLISYMITLLVNSNNFFYKWWNYLKEQKVWTKIFLRYLLTYFDDDMRKKILIRKSYFQMYGWDWWSYTQW